jgi:hypothetical protein
MWIVLHPKTGDRLCKDNKWRSFANFGTYRSCVKTFKNKGHAQNAADKVRVDGETHIIRIGEGQTMNACGKIIETIPCKDKPGWEYHTQVKPIESVEIGTFNLK